MATGVRGVLRTLVERKLVDVVLTTCGTADHDLARVWRPYYHGDFEMDDVKLHRAGINRLGNVLVPNESYGMILEQKIQPMLRDLWKSGRRNLSTKELLWELGRRSGSRQSLLWWSWKNRIPVYVPAIFDGALGYQLWSFWQDHKAFAIDQFRDEAELAELAFAAKETAALMIGGGVSKHHTIWWNQFRGGLDYAVYITTAPEWDGSLSGARLREGISWGKVKETAKQVTIESDATAILPMMIAAALGRPRPIARGFLARPAFRIPFRLQFLKGREDEVLRELRHFRDRLRVAHLVLRGDAGGLHGVVDLVGSVRNIFEGHARTGPSSRGHVK
jgi:deoxyhypusine synthase